MQLRYICEDKLEHEKKTLFHKVISSYENQLLSKEKWDKLSKENERLQVLLFEEQIANTKSSLRYAELSEKLNRSEKENEDACISLGTLVANGNAICVNQMKHKELSLNDELKTLKSR